MMNVRYQQEVIAELVEKAIKLLSYNGNRQILVFKSPTGSGKTVMASEMLRRLNDELGDRPMPLTAKPLRFRRQVHRSG